MNAHPEGGPDFAAIPAVKERFLRLHGVINFQDFISGWFHGAPFEASLFYSLDQQSTSQATPKRLE
jgi:hypothetical protein